MVKGVDTENVGQTLNKFWIKLDILIGKNVLEIKTDGKGRVDIQSSRRAVKLEKKNIDAITLNLERNIEREKRIKFKKI